MENIRFNKNYYSCSSIDNGALIHPDLHNALASMKSDVTHQQQQQQQTQHTNGTTASHSGSSGRSTPNNADPAPGKLFVGGLSWQTSTEKLQEYFGLFGTVTDVLIMKDPLTQRSRGFGFITFSEPSSVGNVLKVPIHILDGKKIDPKHATPKNRPRLTHRTKKIFVGGVSQDTSADEVKAYFNQYGKVEETVMLMDQQTKRHRGFGFVTFENEDVVDRVCDIHFHTIKNKKVECKKAQPKEAVTPAAQLLQKRLMLGGLGVRMVAPPTLAGPGAVTTATQLQVVQAQAQAAQAAAVLQAQNVAAAGYGKVFTYPPTLHSFRYAPYPIPASAAAAAAHISAAQHAQPQGPPPQQQPTLSAAPAVAAQNPYHPQGYGLPNVDMSSFQGVDWSSMYGMGISIDNGALIHPDLHNALASMKSDVTHQQQQQQQTQHTNGTTASHSGSSGRSTPNNADPAPGKLFVGGLSWQTSTEKLQEYFGLFGTVTDVLIMKDPLTQRSRGFGFITFSEPSSVGNVLKVPIHILDGKKIDPKHATPKNRPRLTHRTKKIFVGGVSQDTSADEVKAYFNQYGKVEETVMLMDQQTKRHRGFGFVTFENEDVVDRVCDIHFHTIKNKKVECKKAQPKEAVTPAAQLLQKRLMLGGLGVRMVAPPTLAGPGAVTTATQLQVVQAQAQAAQAAAVLQAQNVAAAGYGKVFTYPPTLHSFRYAPYPIPASAAAAAAHISAAQHAQPQGPPPQQQPTLSAAPAVAAQNPYHPQGYGLPNVDMSSFQGVDWSSMYGMGMYV
ncbi:RNA-binding protein Musashi like Rbp6 [Pseudolycoriella hygida]|uniref:RNA-binding protein Musashi like Rbp6 n=1 Tax=Pseudolycoriella hygida TaxID=35572 RepID=A0A9Q0MPY6_9DIPT|nr:RNA-binding protein Musashi like Rbp6 [Pseudolycoriella hygida]